MTKTFGQKINEERQRLKMTLEELGKKIGSSKTYIWELENKKIARPSADKLLKLADALEISPDYLIDDTAENDEDIAFYRKFKKLSVEDKEILKRLTKTFEISNNEE